MAIENQSCTPILLCLSSPARLHISSCFYYCKPSIQSFRDWPLPFSVLTLRHKFSTLHFSFSTQARVLYTLQLRGNMEGETEGRVHLASPQPRAHLPAAAASPGRPGRQLVIITGTTTPQPHHPGTTRNSHGSSQTTPYNFRPAHITLTKSEP